MVDGTNVLAIVGLNRKRSSDMSVIPELRITSNGEGQIESSRNSSSEVVVLEDHVLGGKLYDEEAVEVLSAPADTLIISSILDDSAPVFEQLHYALKDIAKEDFIFEIITAKGEYFIACTHGEEFSSSNIGDFSFTMTYIDISDVEEFIKNLFNEEEIDTLKIY